MYRGIIFMIVMCSVDGFNIHTSTVQEFRNDDPLFGQTIVNSSEGILVPSPTTGRLFKCTLENDCVLLSSQSETTKGLRPIASVAASVISEDEHLLVCNQIRTKKNSTEYLNGDCTMISDVGTVKLKPYELVLNLNATHNNNEGVKERRKRDAPETTDTKEENKDNDDAGTEIAFVLDGSGSIQPEDFQRAKDFIYNVMSNVWKTCLNCDFAVVQYGDAIRTELSLLENKDRTKALEKVKNIEQINKITKTASAIHHVLTTVFIPENGSKPKSTKMIFLLSDGEILGDPMNLTDVLKMPQMKGITRFTIGVGDKLKPEAVREMKEIADPDKFFHVSNYAGLDDILSQIEQSITGFEVLHHPSTTSMLKGNSGGVKERKKRNSQETTNTEEEEEDEYDPGTEIAFVLDGSGSIQPEDFQRAKDFIYNVMLNVWKTCFNCNFATVQYGDAIRTELSLLDNEDGAGALKKVKNIEQINKITKTASAIHHVLTTIFVPENGSKPNSTKMIIVLSDGEILGDPMKLTDVLKMPQMKGITRFAIGVGDKLKPAAVEEMKEIADPNKFFHVSNYAALDDILSQIEQSITGIEGTGGFQLQLAEAGFSSHIMHDKSILFGAVGAFDWSGGLIVKSDDTVKFFNASNNGPTFSYLGYSVTSAHLPGKTLYISGAPRYNLTGGVFIFEGSEKYVLQGEQVGSYYGSVLCALDIDINGYTDYLLVGAPHFHQYGEEGKVLVYRLNQQGRFESVDMELQGDAGQTFARFGAAISTIGDIDGNKYSDVAVGAPLETDASGRVYIYNGFKDGLRLTQKISPSDLGMKLVNFGQSVSSILSTAQKKPLVAVGSQGEVSVFKTIPVMIINPNIRIRPETINFSEQENRMKINFYVCFNIKRGKLLNEKLPIQYEIHLDIGVNQKRLNKGGESVLKTNFTLEPDTACTDPILLDYVGCNDCYLPIKMRLNFSLDAPETLVRRLDIFTPTEAFKEIPFEKDCKNPVCKANISLSNSEISETLVIIGETQSLNIQFHLINTEDQSYLTTLTLTYPNILSLKKTEGHCPGRSEGHIECLPLYPKMVFKKGEQTNISIYWHLNDTKSNLHQLINSVIIANLTSNNAGTQVLDTKIYKFDVKYSLPIQLTGKATPNRFRIEEGKKTDTSKLKFVFEFVGENKYDATINVTVTITKETFNTEVKIDNITPKDCTVLNKDIKENTNEDILKKWLQCTGSFLMKCSMKTLQKIIIDASVSIHDVKEKSDKIIAVAQYSFNETIYTAKSNLRTVPVEVFITKLAVTSSKGSIIGGSIGGLILLIIIIIILIKCGFFRRRRKTDQAQSPN